MYNRLKARANFPIKALLVVSHPLGVGGSNPFVVLMNCVVTDGIKTCCRVVALVKFCFSQGSNVFHHHYILSQIGNRIDGWMDII